MAEGLLGGILGEEDEKPDVEASETLAAADAFAAAVAARLSASDPEVARDTSAFLKEQTQLLKVQKDHLKDEHAARLHYLQGQAREVDLRRLGLRLRVGFQAFFALFASIIGIGLAIVIYSAIQSRNVVVDSFSVPPSLEQKGLTGRVVAAGLLDVLSKIQTATRSSLSHRLVVSAWSNDVTIEVPEAGISIGQLERMIKTRFGHDQHIEGDLVLADKGGYVLRVRGTGILSKTFTDESGNLEFLLKQAGEYVYGQSQPGLWAWYLGDVGRSAEAISFSQSMFQSANSAERPLILNSWGNAILSQGADNANQRALELYREAVHLDPKYLIPQNNIMQTLTNLGREEEVLPVGKRLLKLAGGRREGIDENLLQYWDTALWNLQEERRAFITDMEKSGGLGSINQANGPEGFSVAEIDVLLHDVDAAKAQLLVTNYDAKSAPGRAAATLARGLLAAELGDYAGAAKEIDIMLEAFKDPVVFTASTSTICFALPVYQAAHQSAKIEAVFTAVGSLTFVDCTRFKGDLLDARGDWAEAQEWYAKAVKLAPSLPAGYYSWGVALVKHGDLAGAAAKLKDANQRGPHWADPLKAWGDVLVKQGNAKDALAKYDEALKYAPNWKELKDVREALTKHAG
jgi:tetratricopeptide (TPR) repeat protein